MWYDVDNSMIYMGGNAYISDGNVTITSDSIEINTKTEIIHAIGDFTLKSGDIINGDEMVYSFKTKEGIIKDTEGNLEKGILYCDEIRKIGEDVFVGINARFTTCDKKPPHYYFYSKYIKLYVDNVMFAAPVVLFVGKMPVAAIPYWIFPMREERHSGFLTPKIGANSIYGKYIRNIGFFYAGQKYLSLSMYGGIMQNIGFEFITKWQYKRTLFGIAMNGKGNTNIIREWGGHYRWTLDLSHYGKKKDLSINASGNVQSDATVNSDYEEDVDAVTLLTKRNAKVSLSYNPSVFRSSLYWSYNYDPYSNITLYHEPDARFSTSPLFLFKIPFLFNGGTYFTPSFNLSRIRNVDTLSTYVKNSANANLSLSSRGDFNPYIYWSDGLSFSFSADSDTVFMTKKTLSFSHSTGSNFAGYLMFPVFGYYFRDVMSLGFYWKMNMDFDNDSLYPSYSMQWSHKIEKKKNEKKSAVFSMSVKTSSTNPDTTFMKRFYISGNTLYSSGISMNINAVYDIDSGIDKWDMSMGYSYRKNGITSGLQWSIAYQDTVLSHYLSLNSTFTVTKGWKINANAMYDIKNREFVQKTFTLKGNLHCWELGVRWSSSPLRDIYSAYISIKKLPDIKIERKDI